MGGRSVVWDHSEGHESNVLETSDAGEQIYELILLTNI